jgi:hypothetical protein
VKVSEPHVTELNQSQTQIHFQTCHYVCIAAAICFTMKMIADDICAMAEVVMKCDNPFD